VGIGNGQELYQRFPMIGYPVWESSTVINNYPYETGMIIWGECLNSVAEIPNPGNYGKYLYIKPTWIFNHDRLSLEFELYQSEDLIFEIYDLSGRNIYSQQYSGLNPGVHYFVLNKNDQFE
jgi:hypothetical protein